MQSRLAPPPPPHTPTLLRIEMIVAGMIALTLALLLWQHFGMVKVMEFSAASGRQVEAGDDRIQQGDSVATLTRRADALVLDCALRTTYVWPYCRILFTLSRQADGADLSAFDAITIDLSHQGPGRPDLRLSLRNFERGLSIADELMSQKIVEAHIAAPAQGIVTIPVNVLRTAPWWIEMRQVPLAHTNVRIDNVTAIDLAIGSNDSAGRHRLELRSLKFHGKWISQTYLLSLLVGAWMVAALARMVYTVRHYRRQLRIGATRLAMLSQINSALELEASELAGQVYTDSLTGALNREGLRDALMGKLAAASPAQQPMAVVFVDLDHFKQINDTHGHGAGDEVLRLFTAAVRRDMRASDKLVRWGGEEFLIVCPGTGATEAHALANKLRNTIFGHAWPFGLRVTASFGVTALHPGEEIGEAIKRADGALYQAKAKGRDCVQLA
jgi:diguanylate cyclase (GGDEF)-like protein